MQNPELADKIVSAMIELDTSDSERISNHINQSHGIVKDMMEFLLSSQPGEFYSTKGGYGNSVDIGIRPAKEAVMKAFMASGGYSKHQEDLQKMEARENYIKDLNVLNGEEALRKARSADTKAIISIIIAVAALLLEVIKYFSNK